MKKFIIMALSLLVLFGCSGNGGTSEKPTMVCTLDAEMTKLTNSVFADADVVEKLIYESETDYTSLGVDKATIEELGKMTGEQYNSHDFIEYTFEVTDELIKEKTIIDIAKADFETLKELGVVTTSDATYISLELVEQGFKDLGFTCE